MAREVNGGSPHRSKKVRLQFRYDWRGRTQAQGWWNFSRKNENISFVLRTSTKERDLEEFSGRGTRCSVAEYCNILRKRKGIRLRNPLKKVYALSCTRVKAPFVLITASSSVLPGTFFMHSSCVASVAIGCYERERVPVMNPYIHVPQPTTLATLFQSDVVIAAAVVRLEAPEMLPG